MAYRPPSGIAVVLDFGGVYIPPDGDAVELDFANAAIWTTLTANVGVAITKTQIQTPSASAYLVKAQTRTTSLDAVRAITRLRQASASFVVPSGTQYLTPEVNAVLQKRAAVSASLSIGIAQERRLVAGLGAADLGLTRTVETSADFMPAGMEQAATGALLQKEATRSVSASGYMTRQGLLLSTTLDAKFSSRRMAHASATVQGTVTQTANTNAAVQAAAAPLSATFSALLANFGSLDGIKGALADSYLMRSAKFGVTASVLMGKTRSRYTRAGAVVGARYAVNAEVGAVMQRRASGSVAMAAMVQSAKACVAAPSATVQAGRAKTLSMGALLGLPPAAETLTTHDDEWTPAPRETTWAPPGRDTIWTPSPRGTEWVPDN